MKLYYTIKEETQITFVLTINESRVIEITTMDSIDLVIDDLFKNGYIPHGADISVRSKG